MQFKRKEKYTIDDLLGIMRILRSPEGCPWDREQTHQSIRNNLIEETYEAVEAIDKGDRTLLQEELGDVLFQVVFHAQLEDEAGGFNFSDVVDGVAKKMIVRHPHVFGTVKVRDSSEVLENWDVIKRRTKGRNTLSDVLEGVSPALPALMRSQRLQKKAEKATRKNFSKEEQLSKLEETERQIEQLSASSDPQKKQQLVGKLLFHAAALAGSLSVEGEQALAQYCDRFVRDCGKAENKLL